MPDCDACRAHLRACACGRSAPENRSSPHSPNAEIHISWTSPASDPQGRSIEVVCGEVTVRNDRGFSTSTFAYVIDDDKLWLAWKIEWMMESESQGVRRVMRYCPGR